MSTVPQLSQDWRNWISENQARGCSAEQLLKTMTQAGIAPELAAAALLPARIEPLPPGPDSSASQAAPASCVTETPRLPQSGNLIRTHDRDIRVTVRLAQPVIAVFDNLMTAEECDTLVQLARAKLKRSAIVDPQTGREEVIDARSSSGTYFRLSENDFIARLDRRIAELMHWPLENGEGIQILHYSIGGEYKPHFDYFPPDDPGSQMHLANGGQRVSTLVMYLNDVEDGGETIFPSVGLSVTPKKGSAAYFEYCNSQGQVDPLSLHAGTPVRRGEKWIATKWMRQRRYI